MTLSYPRVLSALKSNHGAQMRRLFEGMTLAEQVEIGTYIGPQRLASVASGSYNARVREATQATTDVLTELGWQAFRTAVRPAPREGSAQADKARSQAIAVALLTVENRRAAAPLLTMPEDVTATLPTPHGVPAPLSEADYTNAAQRNGIEVAAIKAIAQVESSGQSGFDAQGRPRILFEAHHFGPLTRNQYNRTHPHLACGAHELAKSRRYYTWDQYERLREALLLDVDAALKAASWGKFQVLGENHDGWPDVRTFVPAMYVSEANHLKAFEAFCNKRHLFEKARRKDWLGFAVGYNGAGQTGYATDIANAYRGAGGR